MTNLRLWILLLACSAFGAGVGVGWFASNKVEARAQREPGIESFEGFQREFVRTFKLSPQRAHLLGELLAAYQRDIDEKEQGALENGRVALEAELRQLGSQYRDRIRNNVLPPDQRSEYDRLAMGVDWKTKN